MTATLTERRGPRNVTVCALGLIATTSATTEIVRSAASDRRSAPACVAPGLFASVAAPRYFGCFLRTFAMRPNSLPFSHSPSQPPTASGAVVEIQQTEGRGQPVDIEMGVVQHQAAPTQADDRELIKHQRSYEHWIKGAIGAGITGMGLWMFKLSAVPGDESVFIKLHDPEADHDRLKHDLIDASLATAGGLLALYDAYQVYRKDAAERRAD